MLLKILERAMLGDMKAATTIITTMLKHEAISPERSADEEPLTENDQEIVADFLRRNSTTNA